MNRCVSIALAALTAGTMTMGLGCGTAEASCASVFGFGNSAQCTSSPTTIAVALGSGASARAEGGLGAALALGDGAFAGAFGWFGSATALGNGSKAVATSLGLALSAGPGADTHAGAAPTEVLNLAVSIGSSNAEALGVGNVALNLFGGGSEVLSFGNGNAALNTGDQSFVHAFGTFSSASNLGTYNAFVTTTPQGTANSVLSVLGSNNKVQAGDGPLALAGALFTSNQLLLKSGPGININGVTAGGAAATPPATATGAKHTAAKGLAGSKRKPAAK
ncbi:hypothetical protein [Mycolicibacterium rhodesiae]|uniref:Uncharacterized protein n=1 Tax=Mycolicibacterium rhodesiae TaxID=36814 RepID=A0A1X0IK33_MYCRH|nr:hypothetical protein [Mycolicibacterium rhodesiae]MCV7346402.1 hypothetical protein [Mycolicibacterium rhodesiae]ORB48168.1 hypothetical protein BST42_26275 [Mycolicibacterium rhodesiae]